MSSDGPGSPAPARPPTWRLLLSRRWLGWHAFFLFAVLGMFALGYWQYRRAMDGNSLSWAYTFEWPIFAVFGIVFWAKTIRDEYATPPVDQVPDRAEFAVGDVDARGKEVMVWEPEDPDLAAYNAYLARLQSGPERSRP